MPNNKLQGKIYKVPDKVLNKINQALKMVDVNNKHVKGYKRANDIISKKQISYSQMNRLKNYFDNYEGNGGDDEFKLIGGKVTQKWVDNSLNDDTENIKRLKKTKMDGGMENQFIKPHEKDNDNHDPTDPNGGLVDLTANRSTLDSVMTGDEVYKTSDRTNENYHKEINSIKYLIEYMNK